MGASIASLGILDLGLPRLAAAWTARGTLETVAHRVAACGVQGRAATQHRDAVVGDGRSVPTKARLACGLQDWQQSEQLLCGERFKPATVAGAVGMPGGRTRRRDQGTLGNRCSW
eukprot:2143040-Prymnesium_polylepis.1